MIRNIIIGCTALLIIVGCKTKKNVAAVTYADGGFTLGERVCKDMAGQGMDSRVGTLECSDVTFYYDYGRYSNSGPMTIEEDFRQSFDTYHHTKFFEDRMIDPKVNKLFLDSVQVIDVRAKADEGLMFPCDPCNAVAEVTFKGDTYYYPFTLSAQQLSDRGFDAEIYVIGQNTYKIYQEVEQNPGLYVTPTRNRFRKKDCLSLTVKETNLSAKEITTILKSVRLVSPTEDEARK